MYTEKEKEQQRSCLFVDSLEVYIMCIYYGWKLWRKYGGRVLFSFQPKFRVMVCSDSGIYHGTNKGGKWHVEQLDIESLSKWLSTPVV